jgi:hypothetical protein
MLVIVYIQNEQLEHNLALDDKRVIVKLLVGTKNLVFIFCKSKV